MSTTWTARVGVLVVAVVAGVVVPKQAPALEAKAPSQAVTAFGNLETECVAAARLINQQQNADGTVSPFAVPAGKVFVLTSLDFIFDGGTASRMTRLVVAVFDATVTQVSNVTIATALADALGSGGGTVVLPSGFPIKAGTRLCFQFVPAVTSGGVFVHGFLTPDK